MTPVIEIQGRLTGVRKFERNNQIKYFANITTLDEERKEITIPFVSDVHILPSDDTTVKLKIGSYKKAEPFTDKNTGQPRAGMRDVVTFDLVH